jgi:carbon-monoxide dehydrogenase small subunit
MAEAMTAPAAVRRIEVAVVVNGEARTLAIEPRETLAEVLRDRLGLTGAKVSCDAQVCGACTVLVDGLPVSSCTFLAVDADGKRVRTVEGLAVDGRLSPLQGAFIDQAAFQCGFCTPGMLMAATALLEENPSPSRADVVHGLEGNLCRCTGYEPIIAAVLQAAGGGVEPGEPVVADTGLGVGGGPTVDPAAEPIEAQQ